MFKIGYFLTLHLRYKTKALKAAPYSNPLEWWKDHAMEYPVLALMARHYLAIPATSVACESLFSVAGAIVTKQRNRLSPEHVKQLLFLKANKALY